MKKQILYILLFNVVFTSCKKDSTNGILGKWKLVEIYNGYANGGNFQWNNVSNEYSEILEFSNNGEYIKRAYINGNIPQCIGTYTVQPDNNLEINSNCNTVTEKMKISERSSNLLVIDRQVIEGKIRYKYSTTQ